ncbi:hypothetical protein [Streptomyces sp. SID12501]|uniref:Uncharacterized protein n=1 Tax=Streptomyces sp. SID12501 TaxID=2706042 RepID=A0A6B3BGW8_9ACTN|nr:hypothetical protein [Streptomyces sp. SID12501]NEC84534.1 hypothetical protein [Streptomyces sp. SID12501]
MATSIARTFLALVLDGQTPGEGALTDRTKVAETRRTGSHGRASSPKHYLTNSRSR